MREHQHLCTNYVSEPSDTCNSGIGGGIWCTDAENKPNLYGLTSFGKSCKSGGNPGVATNIASFRGWISSHLKHAKSTCTGITSCNPGVCVEATVSDRYIVEYPGYVCQGQNVCEDEVDLCPAESVCIQTEGNDYTCECAVGYHLEDNKCVDVDECVTENPCGDLQTCWNTVGSHECICKAGSTSTNKTCVDIDECLEANACGDHAICKNLVNDPMERGFECSCEEDYEGDPYQKCTLPPQYCDHPKADGTVKSSVILLGCTPPFSDTSSCSTRCTGGKILTSINGSIKCKCMENNGGCTWDQSELDCVKPTKAPTTTKTTTIATVTQAITTKAPARQCEPLNSVYVVMPPVYLDCDLGAPIDGAKCLIKCNEGGSRSSKPEINCHCNSKKCKWQEWKELRKNEIKCLSATPAPALVVSDKAEYEPVVPVGPKCAPIPKSLKKFYNKSDMDYSCGIKEQFTGVCRMTCKNGEKPNLPKLTCKCKKSKCKIAELKKIKKLGGLSCGEDMSRASTGRERFESLECENPYEKFGHLFEYGVSMECEHFKSGGSCSITCNGTPNIGSLSCDCNSDDNCKWDNKRLILKKGVKCIPESNSKFGRKRYAKLADRSGRSSLNKN
jgi:hypothetical protein